MEKLEKNIEEAWKLFKKNLTVSIYDVEEMEYVFANTYSKIGRQRERLEASRDLWKKKYEDLKNEQANN
jgi:RNA-splicing ligase RtcB|tara:strand:- start:338 stop:544 length:207 start_codon:yes stop_codon:yes gene_type:complete